VLKPERWEIIDMYFTHRCRWVFFLSFYGKNKKERKKYMNNEFKQQPLVSTETFINTLVETFTAYDDLNIIDKHPAVFVQGQPGIGKSQAVVQIAKKLEETTNKKVNIKDVRLLLYSPIDLSGIPIANESKTSAIWLEPEIFKLDPSEDIINILFLDELTTAPTNIQASAYQIALDKRLGSHKIPKNTFVIAAGNTLNDESVVYRMPSALKNRFMQFELAIDVDSWINWAKSKDISNEIIEFIEKFPNELSTTKFDSDSQVIVTPRSWEMLSNLLKNLNSNIEDKITISKSIIGNNLTTLFLSQNSIEVVEKEKIYDGTFTDVPENASTINRIIELIKVDLPNIIDNKEIMNNIFNFMLQVPLDFSVLFIKLTNNYKPKDYDLYDLPNYEKLIMKIGETLDDENEDD
jgi:hypothetical protein